MSLNAPDADFLARLDATVPGVLGPISPAYLEEPRGAFRSTATALARPRNVNDVAGLVRLANECRVGIVPYGGGTGLVGGQVRDQEPPALLVSMERMNAVRDVTAQDQSMVAEAGAILADIQTAAEDKDLLFPLSLASEGSCRIGGNLATNAGGLNVLRWGNARDLCLGVEAVLGDGTVLRGLKALRKDNTGYDLRNLLIGSEGTLGIITAARLRLFPRPTEIVTGLLHVPDPAAALAVLRRMQAVFAEAISAFELISHVGVQFVVDTMPDQPLPPTGGAEWMVLVEIGDGAGAQIQNRADAVLASLFESGLVTDGFLAQNDTQRQTIWGMRESIPEANKRIGAIASHDISVPISRIPAFINKAATMIADWTPGLRINCFGHMGDGNLHYNVYPPAGRTKAEFSNQKADITRAIHDMVDDFDGSISAEHGIGRLKREDLAKYGDPGKLSAMKAIKSALDPNGIMNPGAVLP